MIGDLVNILTRPLGINNTAYSHLQLVSCFNSTDLDLVSTEHWLCVPFFLLSPRVA